MTSQGKYQNNTHPPQFLNVIGCSEKFYMYPNDDCCVQVHRQPQLPFTQVVTHKQYF